MLCRWHIQILILDHFCSSYHKLFLVLFVVTRPIVTNVNLVLEQQDCVEMGCTAEFQISLYSAVSADAIWLLLKLEMVT
jgi:hypothetical protein